MPGTMLGVQKQRICVQLEAISRNAKAMPIAAERLLAGVIMTQIFLNVLENSPALGTQIATEAITPNA